MKNEYRGPLPFSSAKCNRERTIGMRVVLLVLSSVVSLLKCYAHTCIHDELHKEYIEFPQEYKEVGEGGKDVCASSFSASAHISPL